MSFVPRSFEVKFKVNPPPLICLREGSAHIFYKKGLKYDFFHLASRSPLENPPPWTKSQKSIIWSFQKRGKRHDFVKIDFQPV